MSLESTRKNRARLSSTVLHKKIMKNIIAKYTSIKEAIEINQGILIREDYYKFPKGISNIYFIDEGGNIKWEAELPSVDDAYSNPIRLEKDSFWAGSWNGFDCKVSLSTGEIIEKKFTK